MALQNIAEDPDFNMGINKLGWNCKMDVMFACTEKGAFHPLLSIPYFFPENSSNESTTELHGIGCFCCCC
jgi:hypothetical protein